MKKAKSLQAVSAWWEGVKRNIRLKPEPFGVGLVIFLVGLLLLGPALKTTPYEELRVYRVVITALKPPSGGLFASHSFRIETAGGNTYSLSGGFDAGELEQVLESASKQRVELPSGGWAAGVPAVIRCDGTSARELSIDGTRYVTYQPEHSVQNALFVLVLFWGIAFLLLAPYCKVQPRKNAPVKKAR